MKDSIELFLLNSWFYKHYIITGSLIMILQFWFVCLFWGSGCKDMKTNIYDL